MQFILLTQSNTFIIGPCAKLLGFIMDAIFKMTSMFGIVNIGLGIVIFTIIVKLLMLPMTISQQKFTKMSAYITPEVQAIQAKYKGKTDNESMMKQNMEISAVYDKFGSKPTAGCLPLLIQFPLLFALYRVVWNVPAYVKSIKAVYLEIVNGLMAINGYETNEALIKLTTPNRINPADLVNQNKLIDMMYNFDANEWKTFQEIFPSLNISEQVASIEKMNSFMGVSLFNSPWSYLTNFKEAGALALIVSIALPLLAGGLQWISTKVSQAGTEQAQPKKKLGQEQEESPMMQSMKMMTNIMPIMSIVFCFTFSTCIGVYWVVSSLMTIFVQLYVNNYMNKMDINDMVKKNMEKVNAKRAKQGLPPQKITSVSNINTKAYEASVDEQAAKKQAYDSKIQKSTDYYKSTSNYKPGSLASKANMVKQFDEKNGKK